MDFNFQIQRLVLSIPALLFAMVFHEFAHAYIANKFGDQTAKMDGRLTLNPLVHLDMVGSIILPIICILSNSGVFFGWAKPVPINPLRFRNYKKGVFWVSFAGPLANLALMIISALLWAIFMMKVPRDFFFYTPFEAMLSYSFYTNIFMFVFNLIPFPPLDGSKMLMILLKPESQVKYAMLSQYSLLFFIIIVSTKLFYYISYPALVLSELILNIFLQLLQ